MTGKPLSDHWWKYQYAQIFCEQDDQTTIIVQIGSIWENGFEADIKHVNYTARVVRRRYAVGDRLYVERYPGMIIRFIRERDFRKDFRGTDGD